MKQSDAFVDLNEKSLEKSGSQQKNKQTKLFV